MYADSNSSMSSPPMSSPPMSSPGSSGSWPTPEQQNAWPAQTQLPQQGQWGQETPIEWSPTDKMMAIPSQYGGERWEQQVQGTEVDSSSSSSSTSAKYHANQSPEKNKNIKGRLFTIYFCISIICVTIVNVYTCSSFPCTVLSQLYYFVGQAV